jgi:hypothetical protein
MRIVRFAPPSGSPLGSDPHFGVLENETTIRAIASDPLYAGIHLLDTTIPLSDVFREAKLFALERITQIMRRRWVALFLTNPSFSSNQIRR